jgi:hypothetical protein
MAERVSGQLRITDADAAWGWSLLVFSTRGPAQSKGPTLRRCWFWRTATRCPNCSASVSAAYLMTSKLRTLCKCSLWQSCMRLRI